MIPNRESSRTGKTIDSVLSASRDEETDENDSSGSSSSPIFLLPSLMENDDSSCMAFCCRQQVATSSSIYRRGRRQRRQRPTSRTALLFLVAVSCCWLNISQQGVGWFVAGHDTEPADEIMSSDEVHVGTFDSEGESNNAADSQDEEAQPVDDALESQQEVEEESFDEEVPSERFARDEFGIVTLETSQDLASALESSEGQPPHGLMLVLLYSSSESCPTNQENTWVDKLQKASQHLNQQLVVHPSDKILFGKLDTAKWEGATKWLSGVGIETTPYLIFVVARNFAISQNENEATQQQNSDNPPGHAFILDYIGPLETAEDISWTVTQYYYRLFLMATTPQALQRRTSVSVNPFPNLPNDFGSQMVPTSFGSISDLQQFWSHHWTLLQQLANSVQDKPGGVSPKWGAQDYAYIQWLLTTPSDISTDIKLLIQCQSLQDELANMHATFAEIAWILSSRRDVWFGSLHKNCPEQLEGGKVGVYSFGKGSRVEDLDWTLQVVSQAFSTGTDKQDDNNQIKLLRRFLIHHSTPSVLWYDRWATAPIAFAEDYLIHALLFINMMPLQSELDRKAPQLQKVLQEFHSLCHEQRKQESGIVCLIVPNTETRLLTTFGIDFWKALDAQAMSDEAGPDVLPSFPTLLVTDGRPQVQKYRDGTTTTTHGVRRYKLRPPQILEPQAISSFIRGFWNQQLVSDLRTEPESSDDKINSFGVISLTAVEFQQRFQTLATTTEHALVLFSTPSCGHCKRLHNVWNRVSQLVRDLKWDSHMALYKIDVSQNEIQNMSLPWVPDVYYFPPTFSESAEPNASVRYDIVDDFGNGVGRVSDPVDILEWWLEVMMGVGDWMDPDVLLDILDGKEAEPNQYKTEGETPKEDLGSTSA